MAGQGLGLRNWHLFLALPLSCWVTLGLALCLSFPSRPQSVKMISSLGQGPFPFVSVWPWHNGDPTLVVGWSC